MSGKRNGLGDIFRSEPGALRFRTLKGSRFSGIIKFNCDFFSHLNSSREYDFHHHRIVVAGWKSSGSVSMESTSIPGETKKEIGQRPHRRIGPERPVQIAQRRMLRVVDETAGPAEQPAVDLLRHEIRIRKLRRRRNVIGRILVPVTAGYRTAPGRIGPVQSVPRGKRTLQTACYPYRKRYCAYCRSSPYRPQRSETGLKAARV